MKTIIKATWSGRKSTSKKLRRLDRRLKRVAKLDRLFNIGKLDLFKEYKV